MTPPTNAEPQRETTPRYSADFAVEHACQLLVAALVEHDNDGIRDVLDQLTGWCSPHMKLVSAVSVTASDRELLDLFGGKVTTVQGVSEGLGIKPSAAAMRLDRLEKKGLMHRVRQSRRRPDLWEAVRDGANARDISRAIAAQVPAGEAARNERLLAPTVGSSLAEIGYRFQPPYSGVSLAELRGGHRCTSCGEEHANCCFSCPHHVPIDDSEAQVMRMQGRLP